VVSYIEHLFILPKAITKIPKSTTSGDTNSPSAIKQSPFVMWKLKGHKHFDNHMSVPCSKRNVFSLLLMYS